VEPKRLGVGVVAAQVFQPRGVGAERVAAPFHQTLEASFITAPHHGFEVGVVPLGKVNLEQPRHGKHPVALRAAVAVAGLPVSFQQRARVEGLGAASKATLQQLGY
jgi:hypothetical protein